MYKDIYTRKTFIFDFPIKSARSLLSLAPQAVEIGRSNSTPLIFNKFFNLESVTKIFWLNNILFKISEVVGLPLLICSKAKD